MTPSRVGFEEPSDPWFAAILRATPPAEGERFTGVLHETGPDGSREQTFELQGEGRWRAGARRSPWSGVVTDGTTHAVVTDGVAVHVGTEGRPGGVRADRAVRPRGLYDWRGVEVISRTQSVHEGRPSWTVETQLRTKDGTRRMALVVDRGTGVLLSMVLVGTPMASVLRGFEVLAASDGRFVWDGPVDLRPAGEAFIATNPDDPKVLAHHAIGAGGATLVIDAPDGLSLDEAVAWGRARAPRVTVRVDGVHHRAGQPNGPDDDRPAWP